MRKMRKITVRALSLVDARHAGSLRPVGRHPLDFLNGFFVAPPGHSSLKIPGPVFGHITRD